MSSYHDRQFELPGILGFIQNQMGQNPPPPRRNPPARGSFAAFYEPEEDSMKLTSTVQPDSLQDIPGSVSDVFDEEGLLQRDRMRQQMLLKERQSQLQLGRYEAHRKACRMPEGFIELAQRRVPRDAQTEKRCQMFSVFVTLISLLAIFFFAMTKPVWTTTRFLSDEVAVAADDYKALCDINSVIPDAGTAECTSTRSRNDTVVECLIRCTHGIDEDSAANLKINEDGLSFRLVCNKTMKDWIHDVNNICLPSPDE